MPSPLGLAVVFGLAFLILSFLVYRSLFRYLVAGSLCESRMAFADCVAAMVLLAVAGVVFLLSLSQVLR